RHVRGDGRRARRVRERGNGLPRHGAIQQQRRCRGPSCRWCLQLRGQWPEIVRPLLPDARSADVHGAGHRRLRAHGDLGGHRRAVRSGRAHPAPPQRQLQGRRSAHPDGAVRRRFRQCGDQFRRHHLLRDLGSGGALHPQCRPHGQRRGRGDGGEHPLLHRRAAIDRGDLRLGHGKHRACDLQCTVTATAGAPADVTVVAYDGFANTATAFRGAVTFNSTDAKSDLPAVYTFTPADAGQHGFQITFKTAGAQGLTVASGVPSGSMSFTVAAAGAVSCAVSQFPATAPAGSQVPLRVTVYDLFDNVPTGFAGVVQLTSSDARAQLSPASAFDPSSDRGSRVYSARLLSAGPQTVTAAESTNTFSCQATVTIDVGPAQLVITLPGGGNAGADATGTVTVKDG